MDLDQTIEERAGRSIPEIFSTDGEAAFRTIELEALKDIVVASEPRESSPENLHKNSIGKLPHVIARSEATWQSVDMTLALGGGAVMTEECAEIVHSQTKCIYLRASLDTLMEHLEGQTGNRPLLNDADCHSDRTKRVEKSVLRNRISDLMGKRSSTYEKTAHIIIDIDGKSIETVASEIISILG
jgi:shikimate kinase